MLKGNGIPVRILVLRLLAVSICPIFLFSSKFRRTKEETGPFHLFVLQKTTSFNSSLIQKREMKSQAGFPQLWSSPAFSPTLPFPCFSLPTCPSSLSHSPIFPTSPSYLLKVHFFLLPPTFPIFVSLYPSQPPFPCCRRPPPPSSLPNPFRPPSLVFPASLNPLQAYAPPFHHLPMHLDLLPQPFFSSVNGLVLTPT